ncbi:MAG: hypothetical protein FJZ98_07560 [Chloroflexi bacterium]|nr:hypothetical protein [Chloroflexota bacterium]
MMNKQITPRQLQLLSAYQDDQLNSKGKHQVEELLQQSAEAREALDGLRRTRIMLRALPMRKAPRNFTVSAQSVKKPVIPTFATLLRFSSAMAALLLVAVLALDFIGLSAPADSTRLAKDAASEMMAMEAPAANAGEEPQIIFWGGPAAMMGAYGKGGGGGDGSTFGMGGGAEGPGFGIGGGAPDYIPPVMPMPETVPQGEGPVLEEGSLLPAEEMPAESEPVSPLPEIQPASEPLTGSGPILGVRPQEEQGVVRTPAGQQLPSQRTELPVSLRTVEIILAVLFVLTAIPAWLLRRK